MGDAVDMRGGYQGEAKASMEGKQTRRRAYMFMLFFVARGGSSPIDRLALFIRSSQRVAKPFRRRFVVSASAGPELPWIGSRVSGGGPTTISEMEAN